MRHIPAAAAPRGRKHLSTRRKLGVSRASITGAIIALILGAVGSFFTPDGPVILACAAALALIFLLLWQENEPPLLLFPALYQWLSVSTKPMMSVFSHVRIDDLSETNAALVPGVYVGLAGICALALGMRLGLGRPTRDFNSAMKNEARAITYGSIVRVALASILVGHSLLYLMRWAGPASQLLLGLANIRFMGMFVLAYWCFDNRKGFVALGAVLVVETLIGITGFFSDFRQPIFVIAFAAVAAGHRPKLKDGVVLGLIAALLVMLGSFWSEIKTDYRMMVSGGDMAQVVRAPLSERVDYIVDRARNFDSAQMASGLDKLLRRQSYVDFLAATIDHVPTVVPHENGRRIGRTILHVLTPRILFPDKPPTEFDSEVTKQYTGVAISLNQNTSISIGYLGELYIDFGKAGAVAICLVFGLGIGMAYRRLKSHTHKSLLLDNGARATVLVAMLSFDTALIKWVGGVAISFIGAFILQQFASPYLARLRRFRAPARIRASYPA